METNFHNRKQFDCKHKTLLQRLVTGATWVVKQRRVEMKQKWKVSNRISFKYSLFCEGFIFFNILLLFVFHSNTIWKFLWNAGENVLISAPTTFQKHLKTKCFCLFVCFCNANQSRTVITNAFLFNINFLFFFSLSF